MAVHIGQFVGMHTSKNFYFYHTINQLVIFILNVLTPSSSENLFKLNYTPLDIRL